MVKWESQTVMAELESPITLETQVEANREEVENLILLTLPENTVNPKGDKMETPLVSGEPKGVEKESLIQTGKEVTHKTAKHEGQFQTILTKNNNNAHVSLAPNSDQFLNGIVLYDSDGTRFMLASDKPQPLQGFMLAVLKVLCSNIAQRKRNLRLDSWVV